MSGRGEALALVTTRMAAQRVQMRRICSSIRLRQFLLAIPVRLDRLSPPPTIHGLAAKPSERASRSERTAGTIPRLDGNTACTTPDRELNDGSNRTSAPLDK